MNRQIVAILALCMALVGSSQAADLSNRVFAREYGAKTSATLNTIITECGTQLKHIVVNGGQWAITNTTTFPTNVVLEVEQGSSFQIDNGIVLTINGDFLAGPYLVFSGPGTCAGLGNFLYRWAEWGNTNTYNIGAGELPQNSTFTNWLETFYQENGGPILTTNDWTDNGGITLTTNDYDVIVRTGDVSTVVTREVVVTAVPDIVTNANNGYISGCAPAYVDADTVTIGVGDGWCTDDYFIFTNDSGHTLDLADISATTGFSYAYLDKSASTLPDSLVTYDSATIPTWSVAYGGYYNSTSEQDKLITQIYCVTGVVEEFYATGNEYTYASKTGGSDQTPSGTSLYIAPTLQPTDLKCVPTNATHVLVNLRGEDAAAPVGVRASNGEHIGDSGDNYIQVRLDGYDEIQGGGWVMFGPALTVAIFGEPNDEAKLDTRYYGFRVRR